MELKLAVPIEEKYSWRHSGVFRDVQEAYLEVVIYPLLSRMLDPFHIGVRVTEKSRFTAFTQTLARRTGQ